jgi:hypothetical protein
MIYLRDRAMARPIVLGVLRPLIAVLVEKRRGWLGLELVETG